MEFIEKWVVTSFIECGNKILILRRSEKVGSFRGKWAGVSGYIESTPDEQAFTEIVEETSLCGDDIRLLKKGQILRVEDESLGVVWVVHPYLFHTDEPTKVRIDWEHRETKWIDPSDLGKYDTVPWLKETLLQVWDL